MLVHRVPLPPISLDSSHFFGTYSHCLWDMEREGSEWEGCLMLKVCIRLRRSISAKGVVLLSSILFRWPQDTIGQEWPESSLAVGIWHAAQDQAIKEAHKSQAVSWTREEQVKIKSLGGQGLESRRSGGDKSSKRSQELWFSERQLSADVTSQLHMGDPLSLRG